MAYQDKEDKKKHQKQYQKDNCKKLKKYLRRWRKNNSEKVKGYNKKGYLKYNYGLSHEDWLRMWEEQNNKCLICGRKFTKPSDACVDHNHDTGEVRGLLCNNCNSGIGFLNDDPKLTARATEYLLEE